MSSRQPLAPATLAVHAGRPVRRPGAAVNVPPTFSSTFVAGGDHAYARPGTPIGEALEEALGALEGGSALAFASGMAAVRAVLDLVPVGGRLLVSRGSYSNVVALAEDLHAQGRLEVHWVDLGEAEAVRRALAEAVGALVWVESPSNPLLEVVDIPAVVAAAHDAGALVAVDNTFLTPVLAQPLRVGADVVVHSVTKFLSGHSDVLLGATVTSRHDLHARLHTLRTLGGAIPGPMEAYLALRGLRTLPLRVERAITSAAILAERLTTHASVTRVRYPGCGAVISIEVGGIDAAEAVCESTELWMHSTSLGGVESQLERRRRHASEPDVVPDDLIRLSVGIEDVDDLWRDLDQALTQARRR